jgi:hypothetical protein
MQKLMRCKFIGIWKMKSSTSMDISPLADFALFFFIYFKCRWRITFLFCHLFWFEYDDYPYLMHILISYFSKRNKITLVYFFLALDDFQVTVVKVKNSMLMFIVNIFLVYMLQNIWHHSKKKIQIFMPNNSHVLLKLELNQPR